MRDKLNIIYMNGDRGLDLSVIEGYRVHVSKILECLNKVDQNVFLLTVNDNSCLTGFSNYKCVPHRYVPLLHHLVPYTGTINSFALLKEILKINRRKKIDIIHERYGLYSYSGVLASLILRIPYILEVNGPCVEEKQLFTAPMQGNQRRVALYLRKICLKHADAIISVSNVLKNIMVTEWGIDKKKILVLPNAADVKTITNTVESNEFREHNGFLNSFLIGFVGTLQAWYGLEVLIEAMRFVSKSVPESKLVFVGGGMARSNLEQQVRKYGLSKHVFFLGSKSHNEIPHILKTIDVAVAPYVDLPTGFFNSPIKIFEYLAAGRAIVASSVGQIPEIIVHGQNGLLVEQGNSTQLADAIIQIATLPELKSRLEIEAKITGQRFSWEEYSNELLKIYRQAITKDRKYKNG